MTIRESCKWFTTYVHTGIHMWICTYMYVHVPAMDAGPNHSLVFMYVYLCGNMDALAFVYMHAPHPWSDVAYILGVYITMQVFICYRIYVFYICMYTYMHKCIDTHTHACIHTYIHTYMHAHTHTHKAVPSCT